MTESTYIGECANCGDKTVRLRAREDNAGGMCLPCWRAELAWARINLTVEEFDAEYWRDVFAAFEERKTYHCTDDKRCARNGCMDCERSYGR